MNPYRIHGDYPDTLQVDLAHHEHSQEAAEDRYKRELAAHPLEMFEVEAWDHAFDETGHECLQHLIQQAPVSVLYALCVFSECAVPANLGIFDSIDRETAKRIMRLWIEGWVATEQEALQALAVEEIFP